MIQKDLINVIEQGVYKSFLEKYNIQNDTPGIDQMELARAKQNTRIFETRIWVQVHNSWTAREENCLILSWSGPEKEEGVEGIIFDANESMTVEKFLLNSYEALIFKLELTVKQPYLE